MNTVKKFDMKASVKKQSIFLKPVSWLLSLPSVFAAHGKVIKRLSPDLKPPYLLLCTHAAFIDFKVTTRAIMPASACYVVALDGFIGREQIMRDVGCIAKRKFTNDLLLIKQIQKVIENGDILVLYPEARYSISGTNAILPASLGKLAKILNVPVVVLNMHGNYLRDPFWGDHVMRKEIDLVAEMTEIVSKEEISKLSHSEIFDKINDAFYYDEWKMQREGRKKLTYKNRAWGLHNVLYKCPHCGVEGEMSSSGAEVKCNACGKTWLLDEYGVLSGSDGVTEFPYVPDWYEWERDEVKKEVLDGSYRFEDDVYIEELPNSKGFLPRGLGHLVHDERNGFVLTGENGLSMQRKALENYSVHIEYNYRIKKLRAKAFKGKHAPENDYVDAINMKSCIDISTIEDTYFVFPVNKNPLVTKVHFAVEEIYKKLQEEKAKPKK